MEIWVYLVNKMRNKHFYHDFFGQIVAFSIRISVLDFYFHCYRFLQILIWYNPLHFHLANMGFFPFIVLTFYVDSQRGTTATTNIFIVAAIIDCWWTFQIATIPLILGALIR